MTKGPRLAFAAIAGLTLSTVASTAHALCDRPGDPDCVKRLTSYSGKVDFFATGASFAVIDDPTDDRPGQLNMVAEVNVPPRRIRQDAKLLAAFLYWGGSLYPTDGDGIDTPDMQVELQVPGSDTFQTVTADQVYRAGAIAGFSEVTLYSARAEITELMRQVDGPLPGRYRVQGLDADILFNNFKHTAANASFSIVLVFEQPELRPRAIVLFDGMQEVLGSTVTLSLTGFTVSQVPSGTLTLYAQEGDCNPGPDDCAMGNNLSGAERVRVIGEDPTRIITLSDANNPPNDIFNRTINTVDPPKINVPGTDIDTFDITGALRAGDQQVTVQITTPNATVSSGELIGLGYVVVGIDVFAPELEVDSRIEVRNARGDTDVAYFPGDPLRVSYIVSNTGNLEADDVELVADMPPNVVGFEVIGEPRDTTVTVDKTGGAHGTGRIVVRDLEVRHGDADDLIVLVESECPLPNGGQLILTATITDRMSDVQERPFSIEYQVPLRPATICGPRFFLFGGGGCEAAGAEPATQHSLRPVGLLLLLAGLLLMWRRRRHIAALVGLVGIALGCEVPIPAHTDLPPPPVFGVDCPGLDGMVVIPSIANRPAYCIDRYEAGLTSDGVIGNPDQSGGNDQGDGTTTAAAVSRRFRLPARSVTWYQARAACLNAGKRLCTNDEWLIACRGSRNLNYPYGDTHRPTACNGHVAGRGDVVETGAMIEAVDDGEGNTIAGGCASQHGAYDLSGNVWEWTSTSFLNGTRRGLIGGSFRSNRVGLRCVLNENFVAPAEVDDAYGFRCCANYPL